MEQGRPHESQYVLLVMNPAYIKPVNYAWHLNVLEETLELLLQFQCPLHFLLRRYFYQVLVAQYFC